MGDVRREHTCKYVVTRMNFQDVPALQSALDGMSGTQLLRLITIGCVDADYLAELVLAEKTEVGRVGP